jgi:membrane protein implicated in regulation of membrane protease activity
MFGFTIVFWYWWVLAAVLLVCEMTLPGVVFMFLAIGAIAAGFVHLVFAAPIEIQLVVFAVVSAASAVVLRPVLRRLQENNGPNSLNVRRDTMVGLTIVLDQPILGGKGRVKLGDGSWSVSGPDMAAGSRVRVAAVDGTELKVEPAP